MYCQISQYCLSFFMRGGGGGNENQEGFTHPLCRKNPDPGNILDFNSRLSIMLLYPANLNTAH